MKRLRVSRMTSIRVMAIDDKCVLFVVDEKGKSAEIHIAMPMLFRAASEARRGKESYEARKNVGLLENPGKPNELPIMELRSIDVGNVPISAEPTVVLALDKGYETELAFRLSPDDAANVGRKLIAESEQCIAQHHDPRKH